MPFSESDLVMKVLTCDGFLYLLYWLIDGYPSTAPWDLRGQCMAALWFDLGLIDWAPSYLSTVKCLLYEVTAFSHSNLFVLWLIKSCSSVTFCIVAGETNAVFFW